MENKETHTHVSQWFGIVNAKCPRCRVGNIFNGPTYSIRGQKMNDICPHCDLRFERELGYFYVAMFVSYAMNCAEMIAISIAAYVLGLELIQSNVWYYVGLILAVAILLSPFNFRYSRIILLYWLTPGLHYEPNRIIQRK
ncbi:MAG: hypothetical protein JWQ28_3360 [Pedobacter sp.]|jgi:uncharacterized protein (DUF983 family)|nr:hypothetical protein [Pedobacter sp.]